MEDLLDEGLVGGGLNDMDVEFVGFWPRFWASMVDGLVLAPFTGLGFYNLMYLKSLPLMIGVSILPAIYKPFLEWKKSATLGKMAVGIKLVDESMNNISQEQAFKRYLPWAISIVIGLIYNITLFLKPGFEDVTEFLELGYFSQTLPMTNINSGYSFVFILIVGVLIFDKKKQGLHDQYAGTYCIKVKKEA